MITWTDSARAILESHNQDMRRQLLASGADPDEVAADLHRHIEEKLTAAKIHIASSGDVQRILARMGTTMMEAPIPPPQPKRIRPKALLVGAIIAGLVITSLLYFRAPRRQLSRRTDAKNVEAEPGYNFKNAITISIGEDGAISLNDRIVSDDQLEPMLSQAHNVNPDRSALIEADETTQMKKLTFVMDSCRAAGLTKFSLRSP